VVFTFIVYDMANTTAETIGNDYKKMHINSRYRVEQRIKMRSFTVCAVRRIFSGDKMMEDGMKCARGTRDAERKFVQNFGAET
jgi:hypothetical protein